MKRAWLASGSMVAVVAVVGTVAATAPAASNAPRRVTCTLKLVGLIPSGATTLNPTAPTGAQFGLVGCGSRSDKACTDSYAFIPISKTTVRISGRFTQYFGNGTVHGSFSARFVGNSATNVGYVGNIRYSRGAGSLRGTRGAASLRCSSPDGGVHLTCTEKAQLTRT